MPWLFLVLAFAISSVGFVAVSRIPGAQNPESRQGLPFWLLMVWGPSLAAIVASLANGTLDDLFSRAFQVSTIPVSAWLLAFAPLGILFFLGRSGTKRCERPDVGLAASMVGVNLILGPLGEELGWRGLLQESLGHEIGWLKASIAVGGIWTVWHLPLWSIDSPQSRISMPVFAAHCMLYSIILGAACTLSSGSILPAISGHLAVNLAANWAVYGGYSDPNAWFSASLPFYGVLAMSSIVLVQAQSGGFGLSV